MKSLLRTLIENKAPPYVGPRTFMPQVFAGSSASPGIEAQMRAYTSVGVLFAIVSRTAEAVAEADWGLFPIGSDEEVRNHPAAQLWEKPNAYMDQDTFIEASVQHLDLAGEADWYVSRSTAATTSIPLELWPVRPDYLRHVPSTTDFLAGWIYQVPGGQEVPWSVKDVIQVKRPNPLEPYRGLAPIAAAMMDVYGVQAATAFNNAFFRNSAQPSAMIEFPERLDQTAFDEFIARWNQTHQGPSNFGKVGMIEGGKYVPVVYTMRDMQFEELQKLGREFIRDAYGYPKAMLGSTEDVNKAAAIAGEYVFVRWMVRTRLNRIQAVLNTQLLPMFGPSAANLEFRFTTPVPADKELEIKELDSQAMRAKTLVDAGFDPSAVLEWAGIPDMAFSKPETPAVGAPRQAVAALLDAPRRGRPSTVDDADAREVWTQAQAYWLDHPRASFEVVSAFVGVSERTLRRYRDVFEE